MFNDKYSDSYYVHTLWFGVEIKIQDILFIGLNIGVLLICFFIYLINRCLNYGKNQNSQIIVGSLCHLSEISNNKLYQWKYYSSKNLPGSKKKTMCKSMKTKVIKTAEEIVCNTCGFSIKTRFLE